jgi:hypothetical protein
MCSEAEELHVWVMLLDESKMIKEYCIIQGNEDLNVNIYPWCWTVTKKVTPAQFFNK